MNTLYDWSKELPPDETLLWSGRPDSSVLFSKFDILFIPFSAIWCSFAIFWVISAASSGGFFVVFGFPLLLCGLYITVGRFFYKKARKQRTFYAITDKRVLSIVVDANGQRKHLVCAYLKNIQSDSITMNRGRYGTIVFGTIPSHGGFYLNTGMDFMALGMGDIVTFVDVENAELLVEIYRKAKSC